MNSLPPEEISDLPMDAGRMETLMVPTSLGVRWMGGEGIQMGVCFVKGKEHQKAKRAKNL